MIREGEENEEVAILQIKSRCSLLVDKLLCHCVNGRVRPRGLWLCGGVSVKSVSNFVKSETNATSSSGAKSDGIRHFIVLKAQLNYKESLDRIRSEL